MEEIKVNLDNLTNEEREILLKLVEKGNKSNKRWRGKVNDSYYSISNCGGVLLNIEYNCDYNEQSYKIGNYFKTKDEAAFVKEKQYIYQQLKDYALEHNTEEIVWNSYNQSKWSIVYDNYRKELKCLWSVSTQDINQIYFTSEKIAENAIKVIGENKIKKYLFGVEE